MKHKPYLKDKIAKTSLRCEQWILDRITDRAKEAGIPRSQYLRQIMKDAVTRQPLNYTDKVVGKLEDETGVIEVILRFKTGGTE